jgi:hypothetical protein
MDPVTILTIGIKVATTAWNMAKSAGLVGSPEWVAYANTGLSVVKKAQDIVAEIKAGSTKYDDLTPEEIETLLRPMSWEEIEAKAKG